VTILRPPKFSAPRKLPPVTTDPINMAHVPVAGIGGLGLVAAAAVVAFVLPEAGIAIASGLILGIVLAVVLVAWRRRRQLPPSASTRRRSPE
jgi:Flp pilus assembly protein TadB